VGISGRGPPQRGERALIRQWRRERYAAKNVSWEEVNAGHLGRDAERVKLSERDDIASGIY
jgi:hypothetical protein